MSHDLYNMARVILYESYGRANLPIWHLHRRWGTISFVKYRDKLNHQHKHLDETFSKQNELLVLLTDNPLKHGIIFNHDSDMLHIICTPIVSLYLRLYLVV